VTSTALVEVVQVALLVVAGLILGWNPGGPWLLAVPALVLATAAFTGLGLLMAGSLRAEATLAAANGLYLGLLVLGGMIFPLSKLPSVLRQIAESLPAAALSEALHGALASGGAVPVRAWVVLAVWAVVAPVAAALLFRWE
jgi:ABC-2 type transport system permease protein